MFFVDTSAYLPICLCSPNSNYYVFRRH